jgi:hypothetical protein
MAQINWRSYIFSCYINPDTKKPVKSNLREIRFFETIALTPPILYCLSLIDKMAYSLTQWVFYFALLLVSLAIVDFIIVKYNIVYKESAE